ncbi:class I SAM-dependent methyltransferase [Ktedonobacter robiniae]|uniref:Methyltransferase n=1 Tax=Ktedonobacter robiniae TaxID=2778365 RepID=A0ABQ3UKS6_9CHLR|nr:methyltransferase domain-containing protein [Ktedonobacter robiniae]GHO53304.1 methyltransferase [Ktedonobacter robiniae]
MPINFHASSNRNSYADRHADDSWKRFVSALVEIPGKEVADIACGGGIYSIAFAELGAAHVTGVDFSQGMLEAARAFSRDYPTISFQEGNALATGLPSASVDVILERALTHHLKIEELPIAFAEARRLLKPGGTLLIQNRTPKDCQLPGSATNPRGYFFERFPRLLEIEIGRRPDNETIQGALKQAGFTQIGEHHLLEHKEIFPDFEALAQNIRSRKGRSILHDLSDAELAELVAYMRERYQRHTGPIEETCWWTVWSAK